jgi:hypothetical protein
VVVWGPDLAEQNFLGEAAAMEQRHHTKVAVVVLAVRLDRATQAALALTMVVVAAAGQMGVLLGKLVKSQREVRAAITLVGLVVAMARHQVRLL